MTKKYQKINTLTQVAEFHKTFKAPVLDTATIPDKARCNLRINLLQEELDELKEAIDEKSIVGIADALCDLQYVLSGAVLEFGLADKFPALFDEVHRSNMSKACTTEQEAVETQDTYYSTNTFREKQENGTYIVYRASDSKALKSIYYSPADLEEILNKEDTPKLPNLMTELEEAALPLIEYIASTYDPHINVVVNSNSATINQEIRRIVNNKFID